MDSTPTVLPTSSGPVTGTVVVPGSKSLMNRALILSALANDTSTIVHGLSSRDSQLMIDALRELGCVIEGTISEKLTCIPPTQFHSGHVEVGLSGTVLRFILGLAGLAAGNVLFTGDEHMSRRPIAPLVEALTALGVTVDNTTVPCTLQGTGHIAGGQVEIDASASSQFVSGLLLSAARYDNGITLTHTGAQLPSQPHIDMTIAMLNAAGITVDTQHSPQPQWQVSPGQIQANTWVIEPDLSNACVFFAAALATQGTVSIPGWSHNNWQPKTLVRSIIEQLGGIWTQTPDSDHSYTITVTGQRLRGIDIDLHEVSELTPTIAALAALAPEPSTISGVEHIRGHETDRISALAHEITHIGGRCEETTDGIKIYPNPSYQGEWKSYADHRMATAAAIIGLAHPGISVDDITTTSKTMPSFYQLWTSLVH